jgi:hypothetical protein
VALTNTLRPLVDQPRVFARKLTYLFDCESKAGKQNWRDLHEMQNSNQSNQRKSRFRV